LLLCGCTTFLATKSRRSVDLSGLGLGTIAIRFARRPFLGLNPPKWIVALLFTIQKFKAFPETSSYVASAHFFARYCKHQSHIISHQSLTPRCHLAVHWTELFVACHGFADVALTRVTFANLLATASRKPQQGNHCVACFEEITIAFLDPNQTFGMLIKDSRQVQPQRQRTLDSKKITNVVMSKDTPQHVLPSLPIIPPV